MKPDAAARGRAYRPLLGGLLACALGVRLLFSYFLPLADDGNDSYLQPAYELLRSGRYDSFATLHRLPGAPFFFASVMALFGEHLRAVVAVQHLLGLAAFALVVAAARRAWGAPAAVAAGVLLLGQLQLPLQECFLLSETLAQFWLALAFYAAVRLSREEGGGAAAWAAAGAVCAAAALTRGEMIVLGPLSAVFLTVQGLRRGGFRWARAAAFAGVWLALVGGWAARNKAVFGYGGLTPDSATTLIDTALPLVRFEGGVEPEAKAVLREQRDAAAATPGLDPRSSTIDRLQAEHGYDYLRAETALGRIAWEAVRARPLDYAASAKANFKAYLLPADWMERTRELPSVAAARGHGGAGADAFWGLLEEDRAWGWVLAAVALASLPFLLRRGAAARADALLALAVYAGLWGAVSLSDRIVPRIQAELSIPLALLGAYAAAALGSAAAGVLRPRTLT